MFTLMLAAALGLNAAPNAREAAKAAEALVAEGKRHFVQREYPKAIEKFAAAYESDGKTIHLYNIGKCHDRLSDEGMALRYYREYLRLEPRAQQDGVVKEDIADAVRRLGEDGKQQLVVFTEPADAEVLVDGERPTRSTDPMRTQAASRGPAYVELKGGSHLVVVSAPGYRTEERRLEIPLPAGSFEQTFKLLVSRAAADAPVAATLAPAGLAGPPPEAAKGPSGPRRIGVGTWTSGAVAVAAGGVALGLGLACAGVDRQLHTLNPDRLTPETTALENRMGLLATGTNIAIGVAGAAAIAAIVLYFVEPR
jgi:hypothetical protein